MWDIINKEAVKRTATECSDVALLINYVGVDQMSAFVACNSIDTT